MTIGKILGFCCAILVGTFAAVPALQAATVTTNEVELDTIFSQSSFGTTPIDIRFNPVREISAPSLRIVDTDKKSRKVFGFGDVFGDILNIFFVDRIDYCGGFNKSIIACGFVGFSGLMIESMVAASPSGGEVLAHEIAHNLGLPHGSGLMTMEIDGDTGLDKAQVATLLSSRFLRSDPFGLFVELNPVLVVGPEIPAVPLPAGALLLVSGLGLLIGSRRKTRSLSSIEIARRMS